MTPAHPATPTATLRSGSLFSGYGGLDLAAEAVLGCQCAWFAEHWGPARRTLEANYPGVPILGDLASIDWTTVEPVEIVTAGFPCQEISLLGEQEGLNPDRSDSQLFDTPSGWELTVRALRALRPALVILENVDALLTAPATAVADDRPGTAFGAVLTDLAALGFDAEWCSVDASAAGAPHRRRRVFIAAADPQRFRRGPWRDRHQAGLPARFRWDDSAGGPVAPGWTAEPLWREHGPVLEHWARVGHDGWGAPSPVVNRARNPALWQWLMGLPAYWLTWAGLHPKEIIRLAGNGVVPQQAAQALPVLLDRLSD